MFENFKSFINNTKAGLGEFIDNAKAKAAAAGAAITDKVMPRDDVNPDEPIVDIVPIKPIVSADPDEPKPEGDPSGTAISDIAEALKDEIADAKAVAESEAAAYSATVTALKTELSELDRTLKASRAELNKVQPLAALYKEGAVEMATAKLIAAETALDEARAKAADLEAKGKRMEETAKELDTISSRASEISSKALEVSELTKEVEKLVNKTGYKIKNVVILSRRAQDVKVQHDRIANISGTACTVTSQKLLIVNTAIAMAKSSVMAATTAVNDAIAAVKTEQAVAAAKMKESTLNEEIAKNTAMRRQKDEAKANAERAAYQATQDAKILGEAEEKVTDVLAASKDLAQKMDEYEKEVNEALFCDNREEAKAVLVSFGFSAEEAEEILDANW